MTKKELKKIEDEKKIKKDQPFIDRKKNKVFIIKRSSKYTTFHVEGNPRPIKFLNINFDMMFIRCL